jgi:hypothetical protein
MNRALEGSYGFFESSSGQHIGRQKSRGRGLKREKKKWDDDAAYHLAMRVACVTRGRWKIVGVVVVVVAVRTVVVVVVEVLQKTILTKFDYEHSGNITVYVTVFGPYLAEISKKNLASGPPQVSQALEQIILNDPMS